MVCRKRAFEPRRSFARLLAPSFCGSRAPRSSPGQRVGFARESASIYGASRGTVSFARVHLVLLLFTLLVGDGEGRTVRRDQVNLHFTEFPVARAVARAVAQAVLV